MEMAKSKKFWQTLDDDGLPPSAQLRLDQLTASKYWRNGSILRVHIMDGGTTTQRSFVKNTLLWQWGRFIDLKIDFVDEISPSDVRISIRSRSTPDENLGLSASWIGVDARNYGDKEWTMGVKIEDNPEVSMGDQGTVLHEFGHALALHHQHQRSDRPFHINLSVAWNFYRLNGDNHLHKQFLRNCIVDKLDHDILHPVPYDWDSIMHYPFTASMMKPYGSFVPRDVQRNNSLSNGDVTTISMIYPKPKGAILMPRFLGPCSRQGSTFDIAFNSVLRVVLGLCGFHWTPCNTNFFCSLAVRHPNAIKFDLEMASDNLAGVITPVYVAIDPHIAEIYVKENEGYPQTSESRTERYPQVQDPFLGFLENKGYIGDPYDLEEHGVTHSDDPTTVIMWIDHFGFRAGVDEGRIAIDQKKLFEKRPLTRKGLHQAITCCSDILGGIIQVDANSGTIKVPVGKFRERPKIVIGVSGWQWKNHHGIALSNPERAEDLSNSEADSQHDLGFDINIDEKHRRIEAGNHVFMWNFSCCHIDCISEVVFSWVAVGHHSHDVGMWMEDNAERERVRKDLWEGGLQRTMSKDMGKLTLQDKGGKSGAVFQDTPEAKQDTGKKGYMTIEEDTTKSDKLSTPEVERASMERLKISEQGGMVDGSPFAQAPGEEGRTLEDELFAQDVEKSRDEGMNMSEQEKREAEEKMDRRACVDSQEMEDDDEDEISSNIEQTTRRWRRAERKNSLRPCRLDQNLSTQSLD